MFSLKSDIFFIMNSEKNITIILYNLVFLYHAENFMLKTIKHNCKLKNFSNLKIIEKKEGMCSMNEKLLKEKVMAQINNNDSIDFIRSLVRLPSESGGPTLAQELVLQKLKKFNMSIDKFAANVKEVEHLPDYCPLVASEVLDKRAYNLVGKKQGKKNEKSLMLFGHIDTQPAVGENIAKLYEGDLTKQKIYGHGIADDKCGIAMMLLAAEAVFNETELDGDLILMSVLGKRGGSAGTASAIARGYKTDGGIYIHPPETGYGFKEIKNYSMGAVDFVVNVKGKKGPNAIQLDNTEVNAIKKGADVVKAMHLWDEERRKKILFNQGSYKGQPKTKLNICLAEGGHRIGRSPVNYNIKSILYFGEGESIFSVLQDLRDFFEKYFKNDSWLSKNLPTVEILNLRATPAMIAEESPIVQAIEHSINDITGIKSFFYQAHGASDIRHPIIYGNTPSVGIGPKCGGIYGDDWTEWVDLEDFLAGIRILSSFIIDWCIACNR